MSSNENLLFSLATEIVSREVINHFETGGNARAARFEFGLTLLDVAAAMGVSGSYLSMLERGKKPWSALLVRRYSDAVRLAFLRREEAADGKNG